MGCGQKYAEMSDDQILLLYTERGALGPEDREALRAEFQRRGLRESDARRLASYIEVVEARLKGCAKAQSPATHFKARSTAA